MLDGKEPRVNRAAEICAALGLEFYIGPPRGGARGEALNLDARDSDGGSLLAASLRDLESSAQTLNRVVVAAGGDPIPDDLWPVLAERRGLSAARRLAIGASGETPAREPANDRDILSAPFAEHVAAAAGAGEIVFEEAADFRVTYPRAILPGWAQPKGLVCIRTAGDSMEPALQDGDMLLLDRTHVEPLDGQVFVLHTDNGLVVKRLREDDGGWAMTSDNPAYPSRRIGEWDRVVGRVAWSGPLRATEAHGGWPRRASTASRVPEVEP